MDWTFDQVLTAARAELSADQPTSRPADQPYSNWSFESADLESDQLLVVFRVNESAPVRRALGAEDRFGVLYPLADLPAGPNTGWECESPEAWAEQIPWDLDEQVDSGYTTIAERTVRRNGLPLLQWH